MANRVATNGLMLNVGMNLNHTQAEADFNRVMQKFSQKAEIKAEVKIDGDRLTKSVEKFKDNMGNIVEVTNIFSRSWGNITREITSIETPLERVNQAISHQATNTNKLSQSQQNLNTHAQRSVTLFQDFTNTFLKMAKFNTINLIYDGLIDRMSEAIQITNDFDAAMTEFKKVTDTTELSLNDYTETLGELGEATARTTTQMLEAATEFSKSGYDANDAAKLAQIASLYQNIADAEISAGDAASFIISQMKAFDITTENAVNIIDQVNEVKLFVTS